MSDNEDEFDFVNDDDFDVGEALRNLENLIIIEDELAQIMAVRHSDYLPKKFEPGMDPIGFTQALQDYFEIQNVAADDAGRLRKVQTFKLSLGPGARRWFQSLPANAKDTFDNCKDSLIKHYLDINTNMSAMARFDQAVPGEHENWRQFLDRLRVYCDYMGRGNAEVNGDMLRNKLLTVAPPHVRDGLALAGANLDADALVERLQQYWEMKKATVSGADRSGVATYYAGTHTNFDHLAAQKQATKELNKASKVTISCNYCGKDGHYQKDCYEHEKILRSVDDLKGEIKSIAREVFYVQRRDNSSDNRRPYRNDSRNRDSRYDSRQTRSNSYSRTDSRQYRNDSRPRRDRSYNRNDSYRSNSAQRGRSPFRQSNNRSQSWDGRRNNSGNRPRYPSNDRNNYQPRGRSRERYQPDRNRSQSRDRGRYPSGNRNGRYPSGNRNNRYPSNDRYRDSSRDRNYRDRRDQGNNYRPRSNSPGRVSFNSSSGESKDSRSSSNDTGQRPNTPRPDSGKSH